MFPETAERTPGTVHLICGKLCSGKTRYAGKLQALTGAVRLSCDEIEYDLFHHELGERYDAVAADIKRYLHKMAVEIARAGCPVILDWGVLAARRAHGRFRVLPQRRHPLRMALCGGFRQRLAAQHRGAQRSRRRRGDDRLRHRRGAARKNAIAF